MAAYFVLDMAWVVHVPICVKSPHVIVKVRLFRFLSGALTGLLCRQIRTHINSIPTHSFFFPQLPILVAPYCGDVVLGSTGGVPVPSVAHGGNSFC